MNKEEYLSLKEIILGLHSVFKENEFELLKLKELCVMDEEIAQDYNFSVFSPYNEPPKIMCDYEPKMIKRWKATDDIANKVYARTFVTLMIDNNQIYFSSGNRKYPIKIKFDNNLDKAFYDQANFILNSDFSNYMKSRYIEKNDNDMYVVLYIDTKYIELNIMRSKYIPRSMVKYLPSNDTIKFISFEKNLDLCSMKKILDINFKFSDLNPYHVKVISNSDTRKKEVVFLGNIESSNKNYFSIKDEEKKFLLIKK